MNDFLSPRLTDGELGQISALGLAHIGDAVYELTIRTFLCVSGRQTAKGLHRATVKYVSATAQAEAAARIANALTEEETAIYRRARNAHVSVPRSASPVDYHAATALEALVGYLYLKGDTARLDTLFGLILGSGTAQTQPAGRKP